MHQSRAAEHSAIERTQMLRVLVVGMEETAFRQVDRWVSAEAMSVQRVADRSGALRLMTAREWDVVLVVLEQDAAEELAWWAEALEATGTETRLAVVAKGPTIGLAVRAAELGVTEVLSHPLQREELLRALRRARSAAEEKPIALPEVSVESVGEYDLVGQSRSMVQVYKTIARVVPSAATVLILGDSGTGKELVARAIHLHGPRRAGPFVAVNCAAIPENLLESELFGHEKGSFTGAVARKIGRFERASGGTLFLDEIADMSLALQSKILRAIQEKEIERVGGSELVGVDVRLIAATNRDLREAIAEGRFREDLYYRLAVVTIGLPPLRERGEDLLLLSGHFVREFGKLYGREIRFISDRALHLLQSHEWVGNVRELRNVIEHAVLLVDDDTLLAEHLPEEWRGQSPFLAERTPGPLATLRDMEVYHIAQILAHVDGQIGAASEILGIHRNTLARKIREYGL
ncbi:MAG: sigma-54 interaction domain-containing protein [Gemmatimonadota bacterium]